MKKTFLLLSLICLLFGCDTKTEIDPREQYVGTYAMSGIFIAKNNTTNASSQSTTNYSLSVIKGGASNEMVFNDGSNKYSVVLSGSSFTITPFTAPITVSGSTYALSFNGNGSFNSKNCAFTQTQIGNIQGSSFTFTSNVSGNRP